MWDGVEQDLLGELEDLETELDLEEEGLALDLLLEALLAELFEDLFEDLL